MKDIQLNTEVMSVYFWGKLGKPEDIIKCYTVQLKNLLKHGGCTGGSGFGLILSFFLAERNIKK